MFFLFNKLYFDILTILEENLFKIRVKSYWSNVVFFSLFAFPAALHQSIFTMGLINWSSSWVYFLLYNPYNIYWNLCHLWRFRLRFHYPDPLWLEPKHRSHRRSIFTWNVLDRSGIEWVLEHLSFRGF